MLEKWRIKAHMEVADSAGQHVGTVDSVESDVIKLTRNDSSDGRHHLIDFECIDRIDDERVHLKPGVPLPEQLPKADSTNLNPAAVSAAYQGQKPATSQETPLFGTSGHGTGMGGSGFT